MGSTFKRADVFTFNEALAITLSNISPYIESLSQTAASKLVNLVLNAASPAFLSAKPFHLRLLQNLMQALDYLVLYQYPGNSHVVYAIITAKAKFSQVGAQFVDVDSSTKDLKGKTPMRTDSEEIKASHGSLISSSKAIKRDRHSKRSGSH